MSTKLTIRNEQILEHLLAGRSVTAIACLLNTCRQTIYAAMKTAAFIELHNAAKSQILDGCVSSLTAGGLEAISVLRSAVTDCRVDPEQRVAAATYLCNVALRFIDAKNAKDAADAARPMSELTDAEKVLRLRAEQEAFAKLEKKAKLK